MYIVKTEFIYINHVVYNYIHVVGLKLFDPSYIDLRILFCYSYIIFIKKQMYIAKTEWLKPPKCFCLDGVREVKNRCNNHVTIE